MQNTNDMLVGESFVKKNLQILLGIAFVAVVGCVGAHYGLRYRSLTKAERLLSKGYALLAQESIEPFREELASTERGCKVMLNTYFLVQEPKKLEYAVQSCLNHNKDIAEVYLALASVREMTGKDNEAIQLLVNVAKKFDRVPEIPLKIGQILQRNKKDKEAVAAYKVASDRSPQDYRLALDVLQYAMQTQSPNEIKAMADRLKSAPTDNPEIKFLLARAFTMLGDAGASQASVNQAKELMDKNPATKADLEKKYADILNPASSVEVASVKQGDKHRKPSHSKKE